MENEPIFKNNNHSLEEEIIKILVFFDLFERPLTFFEVRENLDKKVSISEVEITLNSRSEIISQKNGFYFLSGREEIITTRQKRYNYTNRKLKIARRFARVFGFFPFVRAVMMSNSIGVHNLRDESDIDLFIITAANRIWLTRFLCAGLIKLLNRRPTAKNKRDKICLSFYISTAHLNLDDLQLIGGDPYFYYWLRGLVLLYNKKRTYEQFLAANNLKPGEISEPKKPKNSLGNYLEKVVKKWQLKIMPVALKKPLNKSAGVVVNDTVLKLYATDRREEFLTKFNHKINDLLEKNY